MSEKMSMLIIVLVASMLSVLVVSSCSGWTQDPPSGYKDDSSMVSNYYPTCIEGKEFYENCESCTFKVVIPHLDDNGKPVNCGKDAVKRTVYRPN